MQTIKYMKVQCQKNYTVTGVVTFLLGKVYNVSLTKKALLFIDEDNKTMLIHIDRSAEFILKHFNIRGDKPVNDIFLFCKIIIISDEIGL